MPGPRIAILQNKPLMQFIENEIIAGPYDEKVVLFQILQDSFLFSRFGLRVENRCYKTKRKEQFKCWLYSRNVSALLVRILQVKIQGSGISWKGNSTGLSDKMGLT